MRYIAVPNPNSGGIKLPLEELAAALEREWHHDPYIAIEPVRDGTISWSYDRGEFLCLADLRSEALSVGGSLEVAMPFVVWYRRLLPADSELIFTDVGCNREILVQLGDTAELLISEWDAAAYT